MGVGGAVQRVYVGSAIIFEGTGRINITYCFFFFLYPADKNNFTEQNKIDSMSCDTMYYYYYVCMTILSFQLFSSSIDVKMNAVVP